MPRPRRRALAVAVVRISRGTAMVALNLNIVRAISLDVTGTILVHRYPIFETYAAAARWAQLPNPPTQCYRHTCRTVDAMKPGLSPKPSTQ